MAGVGAKQQFSAGFDIQELRQIVLASSIKGILWQRPVS